MVTIKQIAELCGVSRGTVDRVINRRGKVNPKKEQLILETMRKLNYQPNPAGRALAAKKKTPIVGVLIPSIGIHFFDDVLSSMQKAAKRYGSYGLKVIWRNMRGYNVEEQCRLIDELSPQVQALIINPVDHPDVVQRLNALIDDGIAIITINNDAPGLSRHTYVGSDYLEGGRTAGALMRMIGPKELNVGVLLGSLSMLGHRQRLDGFRETVGDSCNILSIHETEDDDMIAYEQVTQLLKNEPKINALFVISSGASYGAGRAVLAAGRAGKITIIVFDTIPTTIRMMQQGIIQAALYQHPHEQGRCSMQLAFDYLVNGTPPERERYLMRNEIRILQNVES